ncbi:MAG TPA: hypothetical protein VG603_04985, partial [Chitinophagales bacterium]|nr:hypothetical protein [Chitinophagales bacterium]
VNILLKKNLREKALKLIKQYKELAAENGMFYLESILLKTESNALMRTWKPEELLANIKGITAQIKESVIKDNNISDMVEQEHLAFAMITLRDNYGIKHAPKDNLNVAFLQSKKSALTEYAEMRRLMALSYYYILQQEPGSFFKICKEVYEIRKKKWLGNKTEILTKEFTSSLQNYIVAAFYVKNLALADKLIEEYKAIQMESAAFAFKNAVAYTHLKQDVLWHTGRHEEGEAFSKEMIQKYKIDENLENLWAYTVRIMNAKLLFEFSNGNYRDALSTLNFFNPSYINRLSEEDKKTAEMLNLVMQVDIGNSQLLKPLVKSLKTRMKKITPEEAEFLSIIDKPVTDKKLFYKQMQEKFPNIVLLKLLYLSDWAESKLTGTSLATVVRKNYKARPAVMAG